MMKRVAQAVMLAMIGAFWGCVATVPVQETTVQPTPVVRESAVQEVACTPPHRLQVLDLDMVPNTVRSGEPIEAWRITLRSDRNGECSTILEVRDQDQVAGYGQKHVIRPGKEVYRVQATPNYRFRRQDPCFLVQANVGGALTPVDAERVFCAKALSGARWSLREP
jgi:hypothetical protein